MRGNEMKPRREDFALIPAGVRFRDPAAIPLVFTFGGEEIRGIPEDWSPRVTVSEPDAVIRTVTVEGEKDGLRVRVEYTEYRDFPVTEWLAFFTNVSGAASPRLTAPRWRFTAAVKDPILYHGNGDTCRPDGYTWQRTPLNESISLAPVGITPCFGAFPYMRLIGDDGCFNLAVGWTGIWRADFAPCEGGVNAEFGQKRLDTVLMPGETLRVPRLTVTAAAGDESRARNVWRRWYIAHILPREKGGALRPRICMHLYREGGKVEFTGATEAGQCEALRTYREHGINPDVWWIDAGWYTCKDWTETGTWKPDPVRFPNGLAPIGALCREGGTEFLLWFEPERVRAGSELAEEHPDWLLYPSDGNGVAGDKTFTGTVRTPEGKGDAMLNLGDPAALAFITERILTIVRASGVSVYRQDFNLPNDERYWTAADAADRDGMTENLYVQGYYRLWDALRDAVPGLWIDSCASGGRRNDLETMRRAVPLNYTDVGLGIHPIKQKQYREMFEWIPYFRSHNMSWDKPDGTYCHEQSEHGYDRFAYHSALAPVMTDMLPYDAAPAAYRTAAEMHALWRRAAEVMLRGDYFPLSECNGSAEDYYVMQFDDPERGDGMLQILRNVLANEEEFIVEPHLTEGRYRFVNGESGVSFVIDAGDTFRVHINRRDAVVYFYNKI